MIQLPSDRLVGPCAPPPPLPQWRGAVRKSFPPTSITSQMLAKCEVKRGQQQSLHRLYGQVSSFLPVIPAPVVLTFFTELDDGQNWLGPLAWQFALILYMHVPQGLTQTSTCLERLLPWETNLSWKTKTLRAARHTFTTEPVMKDHLSWETTFLWPMMPWSVKTHCKS